MSFRIRPAQLSDDAVGIAAISSTANWSPVTADRLVQAYHDFPEGGTRRWLVAEDAGGAIIGYGNVQRAGHEEPGRFGIRVVVDPQWRRRGIGAALLGELEAFAYAHGGTSFEAQLMDHEPSWVAFAERRGYVAERRHIGFRLDVAAFDEAPFADVLGRLESEGIRLRTMAEPYDEAFAESVYMLMRDANLDEPGYETEPYPPFVEWRREYLESPQIPLDCVIVAADGPMAVGISVIDGRGHVHFTGVRRGYRGRGLAMAVKLLAIRAARRHGLPHLETGSDSENAPMLHLNRKLGFGSAIGMYRCFKR